MNIKDVLLVENGIRIPKGSKSVKLLFHKDLDGVFSAILTFNQLVKQGINPKFITLQGVQYGMYGDEAEKTLSKHGKQMVAVVDFAGFPSEVPGKKADGSNDYQNVKKLNQPDFVSDHHQDTPDANGNSRLNKGKSGSIGKTQYKSDTEHISVSYAQDLASPDTIRAISNIDSATYKDANGKSTLLDTLNLPKNFAAKGRMDRLANLTNTLLSQLIKHNTTAVNEIIKTTPPSLVSLYSAVLKYSNLHGKQVEIFKELSSENPDMKKVDALRNEVSSSSKEMGKETRKEDVKKEIENVEGLRKRGIHDIRKAKTKYFEPKMQRQLDSLKDTVASITIPELKAQMEKELAGLKSDKKTREGNLKFIGNAVYADNDKSGRFVTSIVSKQGKRGAIAIKRWGGMVQIALNPDFPRTEKVDLGIIAKQALQVIRAKYEHKSWPDKDTWAWDIVYKESGGHAAITNVSGLNFVKMMIGQKKKDFQVLDDYKKRAGGLPEFRALMPRNADKYEQLQAVKEKLSEEKKKIVDDFIVEFLKIWTPKYGKIWVEPLENQKDYDIEESLLSFVDELLI